MAAVVNVSWSQSLELLNCSIFFERLSRSATVTVEQGSIVVENFGGVTHFVIPGIRLQPETCRALCMTSPNQLQFSIKGVEEDETSALNEKSLSAQNDVVETLKRLQNKWYCAACKVAVLDDFCVFTRILPLPSENWAEFVDMWFCHNRNTPNHSETSGSSDLLPQRGKLLPKKRECFVGETFVLVLMKNTNTDTVKVTKSGAVVCRRCSRRLGEVANLEDGDDMDKAVVKFYLQDLLLQDLSIADLRSKDLHNKSGASSFFIRLLLEQRDTHASFRFLVESSAESTGVDMRDRSACLLWLLDCDGIEFRSEGVEADDSGCVKLRCHRVMKLMFKSQLYCPDRKRSTDYVTKSVISMWKRDNTVHGFHLPHQTFLELVHLLIQNCKKLPPAQRYIDGFHMSFIDRNEVT